jgi:xylulokinase
VWRRICAEVFGCPVVGLHSAEGAALGAATQALAAAGGGSLDALVARCAATDESTRTVPSGSFDNSGLLELQDDTRRRVFPAP